MAIRLGLLFGNSPDFWLNAQRAVDLWEAEQTAGDSIEPLGPVGSGQQAPGAGGAVPARFHLAFITDDLVRSAVLQKLTVIGEAAARVSDETMAQHPDVPWRQARGMRNLLVHAYFSIDWDIVWTTATESVPDLGARVAAIVEAR